MTSPRPVASGLVRTVLRRRRPPRRVAAVTGAGSGIGRALALGLAQRGAAVAVSDVDPLGLAETADAVKAAGADVLATEVDVTDRAGVRRWAEQVADRFGGVTQVYANAGIAAPALVLGETPPQVFERVMAVNFWGVVHTVQAFLPALTDSGAGHVVTLSSLNGLLGQPGMTPYCSSKFAVRGFSESLRAELLRDRVPVRVTVVHPGGVRTAIAARADTGWDLDRAELDPAEAAAQERRRQVYEELLFRTTAEDAATQVLDGVDRGRGRVLIGQARGVDRLVRLLPAAAPRLVAHWERRTFG